MAEREIEHRSIPFAIECRNSSSGRAIGGWAVVFNTRSNPLPGGFTEIVEASALNKSKQDGWPNVVCRAEHSDILGSVRGNTLALDLNSVGLDYRCDVAETRAGDDTLALVRRGDLAGSSFAFTCYDDRWSQQEGILLRHLVSIKLLDVSACGIPAYDSSSVSLRSLAKQMDAPLADIEALAGERQLAKLFTRSDNRLPETNPRKTPVISVKQRMLELYRLPKLGPLQRVSTTLTPSSMRAQLTRMRYPKPRQTTPQRIAELTHMARPPYETAESIGLHND
jgi:uncharacterized protein